MALFKECMIFFQHALYWRGVLTLILYTDSSRGTEYVEALYFLIGFVPEGCVCEVWFFFNGSTLWNGSNITQIPYTNFLWRALAFFAICLVFTLFVFLEKTVVQEKHETSRCSKSGGLNIFWFILSFLVEYFCASVSKVRYL